MKVYYTRMYVKYLSMVKFEDSFLPNLAEIEKVMEDLQDVRKRPKIIKSLEVYSVRGAKAGLEFCESVNFKHHVRDFEDL